MRYRIAQVLAAILFGPPIVVQHFFWLFWGMFGVLLGLIAGKEEQVRIWHTLQIGPTYASTLLGPLWSYFGHEVEKRALPDDDLRGDNRNLPKMICLARVSHEYAAFTFSRTSTWPIYNMGGAESRPLMMDE